MTIQFVLCRRLCVLLTLAALAVQISPHFLHVAKGDDAPPPPAPAGPLYPGFQSPPATQVSSQAPAGYEVAAETDTGKAWVTKKAGISKVAVALEATLHDLATFFGNKPLVKAAFEDTKDHQSGAASFSATVAGKPVIGLATCKLGDNEAKISVTYCLAGATAADWAKLNTAFTTKPPAGPNIKLTRLNFPDGTGSVGIADGWTLKSGSVLDPLYITGPADQHMGSPGFFWITIEVPDSPRIRQQKEQRERYEASFRRLGRQPPPQNFNLFPVIAAVSDPEHALPVVFPQWNAVRVGQHLDSITIDAITSAKTLPPGQPGWTTQVLEYGQSMTINGVVKHFRVRCTWSTIPLGKFIPSQWALTPSNALVAPDATFDQDVITMQTMAKSIDINWDNYFKVDWERFEARMKANQQAFDARMKEQRRQYVENLKSYAEHNRQWAIQENQKSRNADNWIEYAGGYRTVIDTQTGERSRVNLTDSRAIVNSLNDAYNDPHRFVEIPLRDEKDPLIAPGR